MNLPDMVHQVILRSEDDPFTGPAGVDNTVLVLPRVKLRVAAPEVLREGGLALAQEGGPAQPARQTPQVRRQQQQLGQPLTARRDGAVLPVSPVCLDDRADTLLVVVVDVIGNVDDGAPCILRVLFLVYCWCIVWL